MNDHKHSTGDCPTLNCNLTTGSNLVAYSGHVVFVNAYIYVCVFLIAGSCLLSPIFISALCPVSWGCRIH